MLNRREPEPAWAQMLSAFLTPVWNCNGYSLDARGARSSLHTPENRCTARRPRRWAAPVMKEGRAVSLSVRAWASRLGVVSARGL